MTTSFSCTSSRDKNLNEVQDKLAVAKKHAMGLFAIGALLYCAICGHAMLYYLPSSFPSSSPSCHSSPSPPFPTPLLHFTAALMALLTLSSAPPCYTTLYMGMLWFTFSPNFPLYHPHTTRSHPHFPFPPPCFTMQGYTMLYSMPSSFPFTSISLLFPTSLLYHSIHGYALLFTTYRGFVLKQRQPLAWIFDKTPACHADGLGSIPTRTQLAFLQC